MRLNFLALLLALPLAAAPEEPVEIGRRVQFFIDDHIVDNRWSLKPKTEEVVRAFHPPVKHADNPVVSGQGGYVSARRDSDSGRIKLWYQVAQSLAGGEDGNEYAIAYAESEDGIHFERPILNLVDWQGSKANNIVWRGATGKRASGAQVIEVPGAQRRGYRYHMVYRTSGAGKAGNGIRVIGSQDGLHWELESDSLIADLHSDTINSVVHDADRDEFVMFCRPKDRYLFAGASNFLDTGESRRIARLSGRNLWQPWEGAPRTVLIPDELDLAHGFNRFYGMHSRWHEGIYWGALLCFKLNTDITTELAWSRDGWNFQRLPLRPKMYDLSPDDAWDRGMVYGSMDWVEMGDRWFLYYAGQDGPHESRNRTPGIGLATLRKNGFVSLRGPRGGGVVATRTLLWPGGDLVINAAASQGEVKVRISEPNRRSVRPGFDYIDCDPFHGDSTAHPVRWGERSLDALRGEVIRIEFQIRDADLFTFQAGE